MKKISILTIILLVFLLPFLCNGATYYVDPIGDDEAIGDITHPWLTLTKAVQTVVAGDTCYVNTGIYIDPNPSTRSAFNLTNNGSVGSPIIFISNPKLGAIIRSKSIGEDYREYAWGISGKSYIIIDGFKIEGGFVFEDCTNSIIKNSEVIYGHCPIDDLSLYWGLTLYGGSYNTVQNNYIHNTYAGNQSHNGACIMLGWDASNNLIENNTTDGNGISGTIYSGIGQKGGNTNSNTIRFNLFRNSVTGIFGKGSTDETKFSDDNIAYQNIILNCDNALELNHNGRRWLIYNNSSYNVKEFFNPGQDSNIDEQLWNNIGIGTEKGIRFGGYDSGTFTGLFDYCNYNCFHDFPVWAYREKTPTLSYATSGDFYTAQGFDQNSTGSDPLFVNPSGENFHLQDSSPCKGTGKTGQNMGCYITGNEIIGFSSGVNLNLKAIWDLNTEPDMVSYKLYRTDGARLLIGTILHPPMLPYLFTITVPDNSLGILTFILTAVDMAGNESGDSNVASYSFDLVAPVVPKNLGIIK